MSSSKGKPEGKIVILKGQEAENAVLDYVKRMNRPYGVVDVAANLKGAVPKTAVQKVLVALAEKGELIQKVYGKTTFFVYNQAKTDCLSNESIDQLKKELSEIDDQNQASSSELKSYSTELARIKATPTDCELDSQIEATKSRRKISQVTGALQPLRSGAPPITAEELECIYADWTKWRAEWIRRRKVFITFWQLATDTLPPQDAKILEEDLGIEKDTPEHVSLEQGSLCQPQRNLLKRKRL
ncbi:hypothetical protein CVT25_012735 [Psilocybe cyanescens]|uniref:Homologous-pairing protein 2 winged helix domain-containing protein n=1 Tax=Psilocybe cyanescens TaxID=93625 RepID=A0A409XSL0_PSICY|nr:hypothetical protein CVT25_012735 [Psilocybe cyanescens]